MDYGALVNIGLQLVQQGITYASATAAQKQALDALAQAQKNIAQTRQDFTDVGTPDYAQIDPKSTQLGQSQLGGIKNDPQGRIAEQEAMAELQRISDAGGLSLEDMAALNTIQQNLNRNQSARQANVTNQFAARGQLNGGAALAAQLMGGQAANLSANQAGESQAAQAQAAARQAIAQKATLGRTMSQDDYEKQAAAAKANDAINAHNMANSIDAQKYNNTTQEQGFNDRLAIAKGKSGLLGAMNDNVLATGNANAKYTKSQGEMLGNGLQTVADGLKNSFGGSGGGNGGSIPPGGGAPTYQDPNVLNTPPPNEPTSPDKWSSLTLPPKNDDTGIKLEDDES